MSTNEEELTNLEVNNEIINSHINLFGELEKEEFNRWGFKDEKTMLQNLHKLEDSQLKEIIERTLELFDYDKAELQKIILFLYRQVFD